MKTADLYFFRKSKNRNTGRFTYIRPNRLGKICILPFEREVVDDDPDVVIAAKTSRSYLNKKSNCSIFENFEIVTPEPLTEEDVKHILSQYSGDKFGQFGVATLKLGEGTMITDCISIFCKVRGEIVCSKYHMVNNTELSLNYDDPIIYIDTKDITKCAMPFGDIGAVSKTIKAIYANEQYRIVEFSDVASTGGSRKTGSDILYCLEIAHPTIHKNERFTVDTRMVCRKDVTKTPEGTLIKIHDSGQKVLNLSDFRVEEPTSVAWGYSVFVDKHSKKFDFDELCDAIDLKNEKQCVIDAVNAGIVTVGLFNLTASWCAYVSSNYNYYMLSDEDRQDVLDFIYSVNKFGSEQADKNIKVLFSKRSCKSVTADWNTSAYEKIRRFYSLYIY